MANLTWHENGVATGSYGKVGHQSGSNNNDAIWSFSLSQTGASKITSVTFTLNWDNDAAGTGWKGEYTYVFAVSTSNAAGRTAATGTHLGKATKALSGVSGSTTVTISGLSLTPGTTYYLRANQNGTTKSTLKCFPKTGQTVAVAAYDKITYTVTYNKGTYGSGTNTTDTKTYGTALTLKGATFTRAGYTQSGWASDAAGTTKVYNLSASYTTNSAVTLYPYWTENYLTIKFYPNGGTQSSTQSSSYPLTDGYYASKYYYDNDYSTNGITNVNTLFTAPAGHKYVNDIAWNTKADGTGTSINHNTGYASGQAIAQVFGKTLASTSQSINLYANWQPWQHDVVFDANGGSGAPASQTKTYGGIIYITTDTPTRPGYTFSSWNTESNGSGTPYAPGQAYGYDQDGDPVTLFAQWTPNTYTVTYKANGGTGSMSNSSHTYDTAKALTANSFTRTGYTFKGWGTSSTSTTVAYADKASVKNLTATNGGNVELFAIWEAKTFYVSYDANGGSGAPSTATSYTYASSGTVALSTTKPTKAATAAASYTVTLNANGGSVSQTSLTATRTTSYTFSSWNTNSAGTGTSYESGAAYSKAIATDVTLFAQYSSSTSTVAVTLPAASRTGYTFKGWNANSAATSGSTGSYTPTGNITLHAIWEANTYTITFNANGGSGAPSATSYTYAASGTITLTSDKPTKSDVSAGRYTVTLNANGGTCNTTSLSANKTTKYAFSSWNTAADGSGTSYASGAAFSKAIASNTTLYAQYSSTIVTSAVTLPDTTWFGHDFKGWNTSNSPYGTLYGSGNSFTPSNNTTLYGIWKSIGILYMILKN